MSWGSGQELLPHANNRITLDLYEQSGIRESGWRMATSWIACHEKQGTGPMDQIGS